MERPALLLAGRRLHILDLRQVETQLQVGPAQGARMMAASEDASGDTLRDRLQALSRESGARVFGVADLDRVAREVPTLFDRVGARFRRAVVIGIPLNPASLEQVVDRPTPLYFHTYRQLNYRLDVCAFKLTQALVEEGHRSLAIAASQNVSRKPPQGHVSHRHLGAEAGIGWIGRSGLLVTPAYGARMRYVTVLTDACLAAGSPMPFSCGTCTACLDGCPAGAIHENPEDFDLAACYDKLTEFTRIPYVGQHICGVCVKACAPENPGRAVDADGNTLEV